MKKGQLIINPFDIVGIHQGIIYVERYAGFRYDNTNDGPKLRHLYAIRCECGNCKIVRRKEIQRGMSSCGCERGRKHGNKNEN